VFYSVASERINFTVKALAALRSAAAGKIVYYFDTSRSAPRGFGVWVTAGGAKTFMLYRKVNGRPERIKLGAFPDMSIEQARKRAYQFNAEIAGGLNPNDARRKARGELTLRALFNDYLEEYAKHQTKTWPEIEANFRRYLEDWANRKLSAIRREDVQRWHAALGKRRGKYVANRALQLLRAVLNWGLKSKRVDRKLLEDSENPAQEIDLFRERKRDRFIQADELPWFFSALADEPNNTIRDFLLISLLTGARKMNVLQMRWGEVSFDEATWRIPETKNSEPLTIPLTPEALAILRARKEREVNEFVFPGDGARGHLISPKKGWRRILERAELYQLVSIVGRHRGWDAVRIKSETGKAAGQEAKALAEYREAAKKDDVMPPRPAAKGLRIHDLRRSLGSWQLATGASLSVIGKTLGHKDVSSTVIYARLNLDPVREAMQKAASAMFAAGGLQPQAEVTSIHSKNRLRE
jgi:integrase